MGKPSKDKIINFLVGNYQDGALPDRPTDEIQKSNAAPEELTEQMVYRLRTIPQRGHKQFCDSCGQRNSIENLFYCLSCGETICWRCIENLPKQLEVATGKMQLLCQCGNYLKDFDEWDQQACKLFPNI